MKKVAGLLLCAALLAAVTGCGSGGISRSPDIRGNITSLQASGESGGGTTGSILVEGTLQPDTKVDRASIRITRDTLIFDDVAGRRTRTGFGALEVGETVEAIFTGPVLESYPVQATAAQVVILR